MTQIKFLRNSPPWLKSNSLVMKGISLMASFKGAETFARVLHLASLQLIPDDINYFHVHSNKRFLNVPLDLLQIEPIRELTLSIILEEVQRKILMRKPKRSRFTSQNTQNNNIKIEKEMLIKILRNIQKVIPRKRPNKPWPRSRQRSVPLQLNQEDSSH